MAKKNTTKPDAVATAVDVSSGTTTTDTQIEAVTAPQGTEGNPTPPAMGNEGTAAEAGEGQPSLANPAVPQTENFKATIYSLGGEPSLIVTGPRQGRWRIGRKFGAEPVTLLLSDLTIADLEALAADASLTVVAAAPPY